MNTTTVFNFNLKYESSEYNIQLPSNDELIHLKCSFIKELPKDIKKKNLVFLYKDIPIFEQYDEYDLIESIFKEENNKILAKYQDDENNLVKNKKVLDLRHDLITNSRIILTDLEELTNSSHFKKFESYNTSFITNIETQLNQLQITYESEIKEFVGKIRVNFIKLLKIDDFQILKEDCEILKKNLSKILTDSLNIHDFFALYDKSIDLNMKINDKNYDLQTKFEKINQFSFYISKSIDYCIKNLMNFNKYFDFENFLPFSCGDEENFTKDLFLDFNIDDFIANPIKKQTKELESLITPSIYQNNELNISDLKYLETMNIDYFKEKFEKLNVLKYERLNLIIEKFKKFSSYINEIEKNLTENIHNDLKQNSSQEIEKNIGKYIEEI